MSNGISIDVSQVGNAFAFDRATMTEFKNFVVKSVATRYVRDVRSLARRNLHKTRAEYERAISVLNPSSGVAVVELNGVLPNMIEQGASAFDIKEGFSKSDKKKQKLDGGWYLTVPFSHATPSSTGDFATLGDAMPESVYEKAAMLSEGESLSGSDLPKMAPRQKISTMTASYDQYIRKHSPYSGIRRNTRSGHSGYVSFRRVSDKSDPNSWIHKGLEARGFFSEAYNEDRIIHEIDVARDLFIRQI